MYKNTSLLIEAYKSVGGVKYLQARKRAEEEAKKREKLYYGDDRKK
jgi:hypothetical protein